MSNVKKIVGETAARDFDIAGPVVANNNEIVRKAAETATAQAAAAAAAKAAQDAAEAETLAVKAEAARVEKAAKYPADTYLGMVERGTLPKVVKQTVKVTQLEMGEDGKLATTRTVDGIKLKNASYETLACDGLPRTAEDIAAVIDTTKVRAAEHIRSDNLIVGKMIVGTLGEKLKFLVGTMGHIPSQILK